MNNFSCHTCENHCYIRTKKREGVLPIPTACPFRTGDASFFILPENIEQKTIEHQAEQIRELQKKLKKLDSELEFTVRIAKSARKDQYDTIGVHNQLCLSFLRRLVYLIRPTYYLNKIQKGGKGWKQ